MVYLLIFSFILKYILYLSLRLKHWIALERFFPWDLFRVDQFCFIVCLFIEFFSWKCFWSLFDFTKVEIWNFINEIYKSVVINDSNQVKRYVAE